MKIRSESGEEKGKHFIIMKRIRAKKIIPINWIKVLWTVNK